MAVEVKSGAVFEAGVPKALFQTREAGLASPYDVTADGQRFVIVSEAQASAASPATVVLNWQAGLKK